GLFFTAGVRERITTKYGELLGRLPEGATRREQIGWSVEAPTFIGVLPNRTTTEWESRVVAVSRVARPAPTTINAYTYNFDDVLNPWNTQVMRWATPEPDAPKLVDKYGTPIRRNEAFGAPTAGSTGDE